MLDHEGGDVSERPDGRLERPPPPLRFFAYRPLGATESAGDQLGVEVDDVVDGVGVGLVEEAHERGVSPGWSQLTEPVGRRGPNPVSERFPEARPQPREVDAERARGAYGRELLGLGHERAGGRRSPADP